MSITYFPIVYVEAYVCMYIYWCEGYTIGMKPSLSTN